MKNPRSYGNRMLRTESMMYQPLVDFFQSRGLLVLREVTTAEGRVDVVAARVDWQSAQERRELGLVGSLARPGLLRAWEALPPRGALGIDRWAEALAISRSSAHVLGRDLVELRFAIRTSNGYARCARLPRVVTEIICCEAKLADWRRGLDQAYGHRFYADQTYLALANRIPGTIDYRLLTQLRVGLLSVTDVVSEERHAAQRRPPSTRTRRQIEERFWEEAIEPTLTADMREITSGEYRATG